MLDHTIAAIATPLGEGGLSVIRISGTEAFPIADKVFVPSGKSAPAPSTANSHPLHHGHITRNGTIIDEVLLSVIRAPRTFTRENVVEVSCHGGIVSTKALLDAVR